MVAHDQHALVADRCGQRLLLLHVVRDAVVVIVRQLAVEVRRLAAKDRLSDAASERSREGIRRGIYPPPG